MTLSRRKALAAGGAALLAATTSFGQDRKDYRIIVPVGAGGPMDGLARALADDLSGALKHSVVVDNRGGAAGQLAAGLTAKSVGDPTVMFLGSMGIMSVSPHLYPTLPYDVRRDFTPVMLCAYAPSALVVNPAVVPVKTVQEFTAWARRQSAPIPYASYGSGSVSHIAAEMFRTAAGVPMTQIPYRDAPRIQGDLVKGDIPVIFDSPSAYSGFTKDDRLRILAITSKTRSKAFPDLPTMDESGYPGFDFANWYGIYLPAGVPPEAVQQLRAALKPILQSSKLRSQFLPIGFEVTGDEAVSFASFHESEFTRWQKFVKDNNIQLST